MSEMLDATALMLQQANQVAQTISVSNTDHRDRQFMREMNEKNQQFAREMNDLNYEHYLDALEYDSPAQQYQRLLAAGLNPAMYMEGNQNSNAAGTLPQASVPEMDSFGYTPSNYLKDFTASNQGWQNAVMNNMERKRVEIEQDKMYRYKDAKDAEIKGLELQNLLTEKQGTEVQKRIDQFKWTIEEAKEKAKAAAEVAKQEQMKTEGESTYNYKKYMDKLDKQQYIFDNEVDSFVKGLEGAEAGSRFLLWHNFLNNASRIIEWAQHTAASFGIKGLSLSTGGYEANSFNLPNAGRLNAPVDSLSNPSWQNAD